MAPKCHRVTHRAGFQQTTQSLSYIRYPKDTCQLTSPQGEPDVRSLEGVWHRRRWGGWIHLAVDTASKGSPPLLEVRHTHTHIITQTSKSILCNYFVRYIGQVAIFSVGSWGNLSYVPYKVVTTSEVAPCPLPPWKRANSSFCYIFKNSQYVFCILKV